MDALDVAIKKIHAQPGDTTSTTFAELIRSLDSGDPFDLSKLYRLNYSDFSVAMDILRQWRLDSYRYERGALAKAASDPNLTVDVTALRYGRWEQQTPA